MQLQPTADGSPRGSTWTVEPCVYGRRNPSGDTRYMARICAGGKRFCGPWVPTLEEALAHRSVLRARADEHVKQRRGKLVAGDRSVYPEVIYFIQAGGGGPIKIGRTRANVVQKRLANLQIASPVELRLIGVVEGTSAEEADLHRRFDHLRIRGEWFAATDELTKAIARRRGRRPRTGRGDDGLTMV